MSVTLRDVLGLAVVQRASPQVVHGDALLDRPVRWVHTSELVEAAALLKGGELLLTTGLGLAGRGPVAQRTYVEELSRHGAAALMLELGWTFSSVPDALLDAARAHDLPLIALHEIVPFVEITEEIQARLVNAKAARVLAERDVDQLLHEHLLRGDGVAALVEALASLLTCPVVVQETTGRVAAAGGIDPDEACERLRSGGRESAPVELLGQTWGWLHVLDPPASVEPLLAAALHRGAAAVALTLLRAPQPLSHHRRLREEFVEDLLNGRFRGVDDIVHRAALVGLSLPRVGDCAAVAMSGVGDSDAEIGLHAMEAVATAWGSFLVARVGTTIVALLGKLRRVDGLDLARSLLQAVDDYMRRHGAARPGRLAVGPVVARPDLLGRALRDACAALELAEELRLPERAVTAQGLAADRLLAGVVHDPSLADVVEDVLGPLLACDEESDTHLAETLRVYLTHESKATAAEALHVRRQTLYRRLEKIRRLIGDIDDPERRASLLVVLKAHELLERVRAQPSTTSRQARS